MLRAWPKDQVQRAAALARPILPLEPWSRRYLQCETAGGLASLTPQSAFHRWLIDELQVLATVRPQRLNVLAPRGAAKSTWSTFAYPLWAACHRLESYIVITSDTGEQAEQYLRNIRSELEDNDALVRDYPGLVDGAKTWRDDLLRLGNGVVFKALGTGSKIRGRREGANRPSLIVVDDPQNKDHIISALQRERSWDWLVKDVCNAGSPNTNIIVLGTALHRECIVCRLQRTPGWRSKLFQSIVTWPVRMDLWREWQEHLFDYDDPDREAKARSFYEANRAEMDR